MVDGITITVVGMLTVFLFLGIMVVSMGLLRRFVTRFLPDSEAGGDSATIAIAIAAAHNAREKGRTS